MYLLITPLIHRAHETVNVSTGFLAAIVVYDLSGKLVKNVL